MKSNNNPKPKGVRRIWLAFFYSMDGFRAAWKGEAAFRQEAVLACVLLMAVRYVGESVVEYCLLVGSLLLVLIVELLNSAVEATIDRVGLDEHPLSKNAKDMASAAVFVSLLLVVFVWGAIIIENTV